MLTAHRAWRASLWRVAVRKSSSTFHLANDRMKRTVGMLWRAEIAQTRVRFSGKAFQHAAVSRDLPIPALPEHDLAFASLSLRPALKQQFKFFFVPNEAVRSDVCSASKRLSTELARSGAKVRTIPAMPLRSFAPRSNHDE